MAKRATKVVPVGAWVELGPTSNDGRRHEAIVRKLISKSKSTYFAFLLLIE